MKTESVKKIALPVVAIVGLLLSVVWMAGGFTAKIKPETLPVEQGNFNKPLIISETMIPVIESIPAGIKARETTLVASRILARIEKIHVRAGDYVTKGTPLVTLDDASLKAQVDQAKAQIAAIQAMADEANTTLERLSTLKQQGLASNSELDKAQANFQKLQSDLNAAKQFEVEAQTAMDYAQILSPIDGRVVDRSAEPGGTAAPSQTLLSLYNPLSLLVEANVRESVAVNLSLGQKVNVHLEALDQTIPATIAEMVPAADPNARSFIVKADIQFDKQLLPGMFVRMYIQTATQPRILIPEAYIDSFGQLDTVWVVKQKQLQRRYIRTEQASAGLVQVISGLEAGETIALTNSQAIQPAKS